MKKTKAFFTVEATSIDKETKFEANYLDFAYADMVFNGLTLCEDVAYAHIIDATTGEILMWYDIKNQ